MQPVPLREELRCVSRPILELLGSSTQETRITDSYALRFTHRCRFLGCMRKECNLCKNNPNKKCREDDNFDECYADGQVLKSKCEADVYLELVNLRTGVAEALPGVEIAVSVVDGESYSESANTNYGHVKELLKNDDDTILLGAYQAGIKTEADGRLYLRMNEGQVKLPDVCVTDKNDTFHLNNETFSTFRLMARAVRREGYGHLNTVDNIRPAVSGRFIVKTQRALNDYRKSEYPHFKDELTKLKHIGSITAQRLREIQQHLDCPYSSIESVEQLKQLMAYADQNRQVENKMLELLNMKGKHKHKWDYLREVLAERVVYDDIYHRVWYTDDSMSQGVIFSCKQGQVNMDRPIGLVQRGPNGRLVVTTSPTGPEAETLKQWRSLAEAGWHTPGHRGWTMAQEQLDMAGAGSLMGGGPSMSMSMADGMDDQQLLGRRGSVGISMQQQHEARSRRSSAVSYPGPNSPELAGQGMYGMQQQMGGGYMDGGLQQGMGSVTSQQGQFQFAGGRVPAHAMMNPGLAAELMPDVYRTSSVPNIAQISSPLYSHNSIDSPGANNGLMGTASGPPGSQGDGVLPPPPVRTGRYRRLSVDAAAVRQMAMMQAAGIQPANSDMTDMTGKRSRNSAPGHQVLEELQQQQQQLQLQQGSAGGLDGGLQINTANRHALYHFESRGRHTPRSRLSQEMGETVSAAALGSVLDTSDIESYLVQNFSFVTGPGEPTFGAGDQRGSGGMGHGSGLGMGISGAAGGGGGGGSGPLIQLSSMQSDQLTGQMQHGLIISDGMGARMGGVGHSGQGGILGMDNLPQMQQQHLHAGGMGGGMAAHGGGGGGSLSAGQLGRNIQPQVEASHGQGGLMYGRELKRCESDSFKRFLAVGLPFSPMEPTPEELFDGLRRDSGLMGD
ncbi:hypothetical protein GPECTOR_8g211 [Gonium pectorale]|uniref:Uncharacterized protein n=1 Tax=Gonium pectorale TaxID=33097 RepID=A0A150GT14_GONPE|nr:hypothetical protein GPECTOR_8g211 [Gonium pectorale]|eukprot:KXZ52828.1 hypothetical protein GPECTOR_8g211 [Gonium pectorale]